jgi:hypothetical protein
MSEGADHLPLPSPKAFIVYSFNFTRCLLHVKCYSTDISFTKLLSNVFYTVLGVSLVSDQFYSDYF